MELRQAKNKVKARVVLGSERPQNRLFNVGGNWLQRHEYRTVADDLKSLDDVTVAAVRDGAGTVSVLTRRRRLRSGRAREVKAAGLMRSCSLTGSGWKGAGIASMSKCFSRVMSRRSRISPRGSASSRKRWTRYPASVQELKQGIAFGRRPACEIPRCK